MKEVTELLQHQTQVDGIFRGIIAGDPPTPAERTVSPAIGEFAMRENVRLHDEIFRLREALRDIRSLTHDSGIRQIILNALTKESA